MTDIKKEKEPDQSIYATVTVQPWSDRCAAYRKIEISNLGKSKSRRKPNRRPSTTVYWRQLAKALSLDKRREFMNLFVIDRLSIKEAREQSGISFYESLGVLDLNTKIIKYETYLSGDQTK